MRIVYIAPQAIPSSSANSIHMMKMAQAMASNGHDVLLLAPRGNTQANIFSYYGVRENFKLITHVKRPGSLGLVSYSFQNISHARAFKPDLVFSRCLMSAWISLLAGLPTLFEIHDSPRSINPVAQKIFKRIANHKTCAGLVVVSQALRDHMASSHHIPGNKIIVAPDGADALPAGSTQSPFTKKENKFHAGYTGHLYKGRGIDVIASIAEQLPDVEFHIVGGNAQDVSEWREKIQAFQNMHFYGHQPPGIVPDFLRHFDVLLAPYQKKVAVAGNVGDTSAWMSPLKIFEYMASGKPMICSSMPVLMEILRHDDNAILCTPDDASDWVGAIKYLRSNPAAAHKIAENAQKDFLNHYTWQKRAENILNEMRL